MGRLELQAANNQLRKAAVRRHRPKRAAGVPRHPSNPAAGTRRPRLVIAAVYSLALSVSLICAYVVLTRKPRIPPPPTYSSAEYGEGKPTPALWEELANEE